MSYDSFDGGSHGIHEWRAIGHERIQQWDDWRAGPVGKSSYRLPTRLPDRFFVVRACELCPAVWWQEYDLSEAMS